MSEMFSRRSFLKLSGALVAASALAACSGGGGGGGGNGGGGNKPYNPSEYYDIDGLKMGTPSMGGRVGNTCVSLTLYFINEGTAEITLSKNDFKDISFGNNTLMVKGFTSSFSDSYKIPHTSDLNKPTTVAVYFESTNAISYGDFNFSLTHNTKKAVCKGNYPLATWTITVQGNNNP